jgi:acetyltransferase-like isoleucine patch superfamily enzyme
LTAAGHFRSLAREGRQRATRWILAHRIRARHPTLRADPTAIWDYGYRDLAAIQIGRKVSVGAFAEILVYRHAQHSSVEGKLVLADGAVISTGVNIRAAGGEIRVGVGSVISQHCVVVASNHMIEPGVARINTPWDETRCGVQIGDNVWIGASCVLLPGCSIGDNAVIAAGSVVRGAVPSGELWGGTPARHLKTIEP